MSERREGEYQAGMIDATMDKVNDDGISPLIIDLGAHRAGRIDESWLLMFGGIMKRLMKGIMGDYSVPVKIKGSAEEIASFKNVVGKEKSYLTAIKKFGLDNPKTYKHKGFLEKAAAKFKRTTGITWPFK